MTKVLVHGNPETDAIWGQLVAALAERGVDDIVTVSPPGFGVPSHPDWNPTPAAYVDWLHGEIIEFDGDVAQLGDRLAAAESRPGLIIDATADEYVSTDLVAAVADRNGSTVHPLADQGHWWMLSAPDLAADGLTAFWKGLETPG